MLHKCGLWGWRPAQCKLILEPLCPNGTKGKNQTGPLNFFFNLPGKNHVYATLTNKKHEKNVLIVHCRDHTSAPISWALVKKNIRAGGWYVAYTWKQLCRSEHMFTHSNLYTTHTTAPTCWAREMHTPERGYFPSNSLRSTDRKYTYVLWYAKRHISGWNNIEQWKTKLIVSLYRVMLVWRHQSVS